MNRYERYIHLSADVLKSYNGTEPFHSFIKKYFSVNNRLGSRDRKQITHCCYSYFRTGYLLEAFQLPEKIAASVFLCSHKDNILLQHLFPEWNKRIDLPIEEKCALIGVKWDLSRIFSWQHMLGSLTDNAFFIKSHLIQPDLFIRIRNHFHSWVFSKLDKAELYYEMINKDTIRLPNSTKLTDVLKINMEAVIQDYSSQRIAELFKFLPYSSGDAFSCWDCCAASGGKSILIKDLFPLAALTVTDKRTSILENLKKRFKEAGINYNHLHSCDLSTDKPSSIPKNSMDVIIADVPCTGSGTWSRTPEWLRFFREDQLTQYTQLQFRIVENISYALKRGGHIIYCTCSVFTRENELQIDAISKAFGLEIIKTAYFEGYQTRADTLFGAILKKN